MQLEGIFMATLKRVFILRLKDEYFDKLEYATKKEHRSLTNLIELSVIKYLEEFENLNGNIKINNADNQAIWRKWTGPC